MLVDSICGQVVDIENRINSRFLPTCPLSTTIFKEIIINRKKGKRKREVYNKSFPAKYLWTLWTAKKEEFNERNLDQSFRRGRAE